MNHTVTPSDTNTSVKSNQSKALAPKLRFKGFDEPWHIIQFQDVADKKIKWSITGGPFGSNLKASDYCETGIRILQLQNLGDGIFHDEYKIYTSEEKANELISCNIYPNEIIISKMGDPVARACIIPNSEKRFLMASDGIRLVVDEKRFSKYYIFSYINHPLFRNVAISNSTGSTRKRIGLNELKIIPINLPSLPEQQKIAAFLSAVDEKIQLLTRKKELLTQYKKGVMQQLFSGKLRFKDDQGKDFPEWEEKKLGNLTYKVGKKNNKNIKYPIYSINNQEGFRPQSEQFDGLDSNDRGYDISLYKIFEAKTFAYNPARINVGSIGYSHNIKEGIVSSLYVCFKTKEKLEDLYLLCYLETYKFKMDIFRFEEGGVRQYLFFENFSQIKIPLPSIDEQKQITKFSNEIDIRINVITKQIFQTQNFKKGLLQQMFV